MPGQVNERGSVFVEYLFMKHSFCNNSVHVMGLCCECVLKAALPIEATTDALQCTLCNRLKEKVMR